MVNRKLNCHCCLNYLQNCGCYQIGSISAGKACCRNQQLLWEVDTTIGCSRDFNCKHWFTVNVNDSPTTKSGNDIVKKMYDFLFMSKTTTFFPVTTKGNDYLRVLLK